MPSQLALEGSAPPLRTEEVPADLICSICYGVPLTPKITPCEHLFCVGCARQAFHASPSCPNCRQSCNQRQLKALSHGSLLYRIWSGIAVKCPQYEKGCAWSGSAIDAADHAERCEHTRGASQDARVAILEEQIRDQKERAEAMKLEHTEEIEKLQKVLLKIARDGRLRLPVLFTGTYNYRRENVVELSQLISRYLENKPDEIDRNRIFDCVKGCYTDLKKGYNDNPEYYGIDMQLLLVTCRSTSGWFTSKQLDNIASWLLEMR